MCPEAVQGENILKDFFNKHAICCDEPIIHFEVHLLGELKLQHFLLTILFITKNNVDFEEMTTYQLFKACS